MKTTVDKRLVEEAERYRLRLFCEDCAHFEPTSERCGEGFPNREHRRVPLPLVHEICFCKSFELC